MALHHTLIHQALSQWHSQRLYLSLDTTVVWNCFCIVWIGVVDRGRTVPVAWRVVASPSSTVGLWTIQRVLYQAKRVVPDGVTVVLLADRGFADGKLMKYLKQNSRWHFRIRIKRSFQFQIHGQWRKVLSIHLQPGQAYFTPAVLDLKSNGFNLEASRLRNKFALSQLCGVMALTMLFNLI